MPSGSPAQNPAALRRSKRLALQKVAPAAATVKPTAPHISVEKQSFPGAEHLTPTEFSSIPKLERQIQISRNQLAQQQQALANLKKSITDKENKIRAQEKVLRKQLNKMEEKTARRDQLIQHRAQAGRGAPATTQVFVKREPSEPRRLTPPQPAWEQAVHRSILQPNTPPKSRGDGLGWSPGLYDVPEWNPHQGGNVRSARNPHDFPGWKPRGSVDGWKNYCDPDKPTAAQAGPRELRYSESPQKPRVKREGGGLFEPEETAHVRRRLSVLRVHLGETDRPVKREREESPPHSVSHADSCVKRVKRVKLEPQSPKAMAGVQEREIIVLSD
ncbi:hypothetical protein B0H67DRAFT_655548 [Lasiosphaeris hirsuta]|uniref:Uncharacterized protein n=1 Tax=Lasiosphaeris hirsuta TaxID=260670 RepID=A0AA40BDG5_9PEZI|nr:hypothetical protein B0H67DRAFT_655548 [Lasiosphaeris hirsuta]